MAKSGPEATKSRVLTHGYYATRYVPYPSREQIWKHITRYLEPLWNLTDDSAVLELGAGYGSWIRWIRTKRRYAQDINPELPRLLLENGVKNVIPSVGSCMDLGAWESSSLNLLLASNLLEHLELEEVVETLNESYRVLENSGMFCVIQPNFAICPRQYFDDFTHKTVFTQVSLKDLFESCGFETVRVWKRFLPFTMKGAGGKLTFLVPYYLRSPWKPFAGQMCLLLRKSY